MGLIWQIGAILTVLKLKSRRTQVQGKKYESFWLLKTLTRHVFSGYIFIYDNIRGVSDIFTPHCDPFGSKEKLFMAQNDRCVSGSQVVLCLYFMVLA